MIFYDGGGDDANIWKSQLHIDALVQDCSKSNNKALELLQSCTKPLRLRIMGERRIWLEWNTVGELKIRQMKNKTPWYLYIKR